MKNNIICTECMQKQTYTLRKELTEVNFKGKNYYFTITTATCDCCGAKVFPHGLRDLNQNEIMQQYRKKEDLVSIDDIKRLMELYKIGKAPLSLALGFGEITITRYLDGQIPTKKYSNIIKKALISPSYMKSMLDSNRDKITDVAYDRAIFAATCLENMFNVSQKMLNVIAYLFSCLGEITLSELQRLLYFSQGITLSLHDVPLFDEELTVLNELPCYINVMDLLSDFKYDPTSDTRYLVIKDTESILSKSESQIINLVVTTFGRFSTAILNQCTKSHSYSKNDSDIITKSEMKTYFDYLNLKYDLSTELGINRFISDSLTI